MIVIPMAGLSSRFKEAGYTLPKYMLEAHGKTLFFHSVESFKNIFEQESFLFIALDVFDVEKFIKKECLNLGIKNFQIVILKSPTRGQAETVYLGLNRKKVKDDEHLLIFNIDTFRPGFSWPKNFDIRKVDGYLETFIGTGKNWSNVLPKDDLSNEVLLTAEKQEISNYCCTGLYYWRRSGDFCRIFESYQKNDLSEVQAGEYYIAPMYNEIIKSGMNVRFSVVNADDVIFCGVPDEYQSFKDRRF